jgi:hypothetical protein
MAPLIINCKRYAELSSSDLDRPLSFWERVALKIHQVACPPCNEVRDQLKLIHDACRWLPDEDESGPDDRRQCVMPEEVRQQIKSVLKNL